MPCVMLYFSRGLSSHLKPLNPTLTLLYSRFLHVLQRSLQEDQPMARPEPAGYHAMRIVGWGEDEMGLKEIIHFLANERYIWGKKN